MARDDTTPSTIAITGASSGIGRALALALARQGHRIIAIARRGDELEALARAQPGIVPLVADLGRSDDVAALAARILAIAPDLSVLVNNAGVQHDVRFEDPAMDAGAIATDIQVNLMAPILLTRALLPALARRPRGLIVNVTSLLADVPKRSAAPYSAAKAGLSMFGRALAGELAGSTVRIIEIVPPLVDTAMTAGRGSGKISPEAAAKAIIEGMARRQGRIAIGKARPALWLARLAPWLVTRILARQ